MRKILYVVLALAFLLITASCQDRQVVSGETWDGNYLYYNGYKTKTNDIDKIFYLKDFLYEQNTVTVKSYIYTGYYFNILHMIVTDANELYYYIRFNPQNNEILSVNRYNDKIAYHNNYGNFISFEKSNEYNIEYIFVSSAGIFPAVTSFANNYGIKEDYLVVNYFKLYYAKPNSNDFVVVNETTVKNYAFYNGKIYYETNNTYNIYDCTKDEKHTFAMESCDTAIFLQNGAYIAGQLNENVNSEIQETLQSYSINPIYKDLVVIAYDDNYEEKRIVLPAEYDCSKDIRFVNGYTNLILYEYKANGIINHHYYHFGEDYILNPGVYVPSESGSSQQSPIYDSKTCGIYKYYYQYKNNKNYTEQSLYGENTETKKQYLCYTVRLKYAMTTPKIIVILPY